jgi:hypothetical protein
MERDEKEGSVTRLLFYEWNKQKVRELKERIRLPYELSHDSFTFVADEAHCPNNFRPILPQTAVYKNGQPS